MFIVAFCNTKVGKKIRMGKKRHPINDELTFVNSITGPSRNDEVRFATG